jgi:hypothetical protein
LTNLLKKVLFCRLKKYMMQHSGISEVKGIDFEARDKKALENVSGIVSVEDQEFAKAVEKTLIGDLLKYLEKLATALGKSAICILDPYFNTEKNTPKIDDNILSIQLEILYKLATDKAKFLMQLVKYLYPKFLSKELIVEIKIGETPLYTLIRQCLQDYSVEDLKYLSMVSPFWIGQHLDNTGSFEAAPKTDVGRPTAPIAPLSPKLGTGN